MSGSYNGYVDEQRDDAPSRRNAPSHSTDALRIPTYGTPASPATNDPRPPSYGTPASHATNDPRPRTLMGAISRGVLEGLKDSPIVEMREYAERRLGKVEASSNHVDDPRTDDGPASTAGRPPLRGNASEGGGGMAKSHATIMNGVGDKLSSVGDRIGTLCRSGDRGIYSSESAESWGSTVSAFTTQKVMPMFRRQSAASMMANVNVGNRCGAHSEKEASFDYQLMKDNE